MLLGRREGGGSERAHLRPLVGDAGCEYFGFGDGIGLMGSGMISGRLMVSSNQAIAR